MAPQLTEDDIDDLNYFARAGETDDLKQLVSAIADREKVPPAEILAAAVDESKSTCLHKATGNGHLDTVQVILSFFEDRPADEKKAFVDATNEFGNTGLHWAALGGHLPVVRCLAEQHGASVGLANDRNYVPLDLASFGEEPKRDVVDYFLSTMDRMEAAGGLEVVHGEEETDERTEKETKEKTEERTEERC